MQAAQLRETYQQFFEARGHRRIPSAPLMPENDPSVLFTTAGMQPLAPYLLGEPHPQGRRLVNVQRCIRTNDIEEVGDASHLTFFEMLGNWSLGDYFKRESLAWSYEFLTLELGLDPGDLAVTVFAGDEFAPRDEESFHIWRSLGMPQERIFFLPRADNWWGPVGASGPCGPDSEMFFNTGRPAHPGCQPGCPCGRWFEIWNNVFMEYNRTPEGEYEKLVQHNVDTGMGVDRTLAVLNGYADIFHIETVWPLVEQLQELSGREYAADPAPFRIIADHLRAAAVAIADGASPSNVEAGYVVRRMIRRAVVHARKLGLTRPFCSELARRALGIFSGVYPELDGRADWVAAEMQAEEARFQETLERGLKRYEQVQEKVLAQSSSVVPATEAFDLYQTYGFPLPLTEELAHEQGLEVDTAGFERLLDEHRAISRRGMEQKFRGGLADTGEATTRLHTATHLLHGALRRLLGPEVRQMGSNITPDRLRFDFSWERKLTPEELARVEALVNEQIRRDLPVSFQVQPLEAALAGGALAFFGEKYGDLVKVYSVGDFSREVCGGPHVTRSGELGRFRIVKEEAVGRGVRRIRAVLEEPD